MIRALVLVLVLAVGLASAALFQGRMHHARLVVPEALPDWSAVVTDDSGLRQGKADLPQRGRWPALHVQWTARAPGPEGWVWDISLTGPGVALKGRATLGFLAENLMVSDLRGSVDLAAVADSPVALRGIARIEAGEATVIDLRDIPRASGAISGRLAAFQLDGADFGEGPLTGELDDAGQWRAILALSGGVSAAQAVLTGALSEPMARLEATFEDGAALPPTMRAMLAAAGQAEGQGWRLSVAVPVR